METVGSEDSVTRMQKHCDVESVYEGSEWIWGIS